MKFCFVALTIVVVSSGMVLGGTTTCLPDGLVCANGGSVASCEAEVPCSLGNDSTNFYGDNCTCSSAMFYGPDCALRNASSCASGQKWSADPWVPGAVAQVRCWLDLEGQEYLDMRKQRADIEFDAVSGNGSFVVSSRHRDSVGSSLCARALDDVSCALSGCSLSSEDDGLVRCAMTSCRSCGQNSTETHCSPVMGVLVEHMSGAPMQFKFHDRDGAKFNLAVQTNSIPLHFHCEAGSCY